MAGGNSGTDTQQQQQASTSSTQNITIEATPKHQYLLNGVVTDVEVLVDIKVPERIREESSEDDRPAFELSLVLDRSGSMSGDKFKYSKEAIINVINNLTARDIVHFVVYDNSVDTIFANGNISNRETLISQVRSISTGGCTNLYGGLERGNNLIKEAASTRDTSVRYQKRVFLFSDGLVNEGLQDRDQILKNVEAMTEEGVQISTFGVGNDFDEVLMKGISTSGRGFFFFIPDAESIPKIVGKGLRGIISTVGNNANIKFRGKNGALVKKIFNKPAETVTNGVPLKELKEADWKRVIVLVEARPPTPSNESTSSPAATEILSYTLQYETTAEENATPTTITLEGTVSVTFTDNESQVSAAENSSQTVVAAVTIATAGEVDQTVVQLIEQNRLDEAIAEKKKLVQAYAAIRHTDRISEAMYSRQVATLGVMESRDVQRAKKEAYYDCYMEAEEEDMGYGLF